MDTINKVTLAFDESGQFERKPVTNCVIGGCIVYNDDESFVNKIKSDLTMFAENNKIQYKALAHNAGLLKNYKTKEVYFDLVETLKNIIKQQENIRGHRLYCKTKKQTDNIITKINTFEFYLKMLNTLFENILIYNPKLYKKNISTLEIIYPSRKVPLSYFSQEERKSIMDGNFALTRYKENDNGKADKSKKYSIDRGSKYAPKDGFIDYVNIFSVDTIRMIISEINEERINSGLGNFKNVKLTYHTEDNEPHPYFVMSDVACSATLTNRLPKFNEETNKLIHTFRYKTINDEFQKCLNYFFSKNFGEFYLRSLKFKRHHQADNYSTYHDWLNDYESIMKKEIDKEGVNKLIKFGKNEVAKKRAGYYSEIKQILSLPLEEENFSKLSTETKVKLFDALVRCENHLGHIKEGLEIKDKLKSIEGEIKANRQLSSEYILTINRMSVIYSNSFKFKEAINLLNDYIDKRCTENKEGNYLKDVVLAKLFGSLGQNLAFLGKYQKALDYLVGSYQTFPPSYNREETMIHLGNLYLDSMIYDVPLSINRKEIVLKEKFYKIINELVPTVNNSDILMNALQECIIAQKNPFLIRLILKGAVAFGKYNVAELVKADFITYLGEQDQHPFEMICKDGAILHLENNPKANQIANLIKISLDICKKRNSPIMLAIAVNNLIDLFKHKKNLKHKKILQEHFCELIDLTKQSPGFNFLDDNLKKIINKQEELSETTDFSDYQKFFRFNYH